MDHPRIRGEHGSTARMSGFRVGSSPHTRGARLDVPVNLGVCGIIPAYAGSTACATSVLRLSLDHPRIRGEHPVSPGVPAVTTGSSPHTRGALHRDGIDVHPVRIIPAYAGSTSARWERSSSTKDHPRIRGEHSAAWRSPSVNRRIIPAYAGSTTRTLWRRRGGGGSSPHTRGAPQADASLRIVATDHPRIRGEHRPRGFRSAPGPGSSPHTRGALIVGELVAGERRIIPAYAGSTSARMRSRSTTRDHPRIRGEHNKVVILFF